MSNTDRDTSSVPAKTVEFTEAFDSAGPPSPQGEGFYQRFSKRCTDVGLILLKNKEDDRKRT